MDIDMMIIYATIGAGVCLAAYKLYNKIMADGKVTVDEIVDLIEDLGSIAKTLPSSNKLKQMKKAELIALCEENDLDIDGVKADLVARLDTLRA
tara:strand:+ start:2510 stop:2791 length:282 start_codon:yes stop_codon:yes gene_type:complete